MTAQLTLSGPNSSITTGQVVSRLWPAHGHTSTCHNHDICWMVLCCSRGVLLISFRFDLFYFTSLSQLRPNYKLGTLFFWDEPSSQSAVQRVRRWWFVLEWTIVAKLIISFPWLFWFEITKVIWKPGCKKANRNCVLLQADDLGNYYVQQIREK